MWLDKSETNEIKRFVEHQKASKYSFGLRPEEKIKNTNPAPNAYELAAAAELLETQLQYTFGLRPERKTKFITPAPSAYRPEDCKNVYVFR